MAAKNCKNKIGGRINYNTHKGYKEYKKVHHGSDVTYTQFMDIIKQSNIAIREMILDNPLGFKLPYNMGYIAVDKFKPSKKFQAIDWISSRKLGKKIPRTNFHSFGYSFKVKFYKNPSFRPLAGYSMKAHRKLNRELAQNIIKDLKQYISIDRTYYSKRFRIDKIIKQP